jgi:hypothetical protein
MDPILLIPLILKLSEAVMEIEGNWGNPNYQFSDLSELKAAHKELEDLLLSGTLE